MIRNASAAHNNEAIGTKQWKTLINLWKTLAHSLVLKYCHIAVAHKLPDSKNVKNRHIVKFIQRGKVELYKNRKNLVGKNISHLPSIEDGNGKIFINESLTSYRKRLFGRIREYKRKNNAKYLWTSNGKIMLKLNDTSPTQAFTTHEEFEDYLHQISNCWMT